MREKNCPPPHRDIDSGVIWLDEVDSTNSHILRHRELLQIPWVTVVARSQKWGRGRKERRWHSTPGRDLTFSLVYLPTGKLREVRSVTLIAGVAVHSVLETISGVKAKLKWPNDLRVDGKKICGILTELHMEKREPAILIGVGLNVNSRRFAEGGGVSATSILMESDVKHDLPTLLSHLRSELIDNLSDFTAGRSEELLNRWKRASDSIGKYIRTESAGRILEGVFHDITEDGEVILLDRKGEAHVCTGEIEYLDYEKT